MHIIFYKNSYIMPAAAPPETKSLLSWSFLNYFIPKISPTLGKWLKSAAKIEPVCTFFYNIMI